MGTTAAIVIATPRDRAPRVVCMRMDGHPGRVVPTIRSIAKRHRHTLIIDPATVARILEEGTRGIRGA